MWRACLDKLNARSGTLTAAFALMMFGTFMVFKGLHDDHVIDFHLAFFAGQFKTGSTGAFFATLGVIFALGAIAKPPLRQRLKVESDGMLIEWDGRVGDPTIFQAHLAAITELVIKAKSGAHAVNDSATLPGTERT